MPRGRRGDQGRAQGARAAGGARLDIGAWQLLRRPSSIARA